MSKNFIAQSSDRILITGSSGFIGAKVLELLIEYGFVNLRCFVRPFSRRDRLENIIRNAPISWRRRIAAGLPKA
jgi:thioester reductase-like protein